MEDYTLYIVNIKSGIVTDSNSFKCDKIAPSFNQGLSLCGSMLAILSVQHQSVYVFLVENGSFVPIQNIGRFCYPDDPLICSSVKYMTKQGGTETVLPYQEAWYTSLKQRLLCWLLRDAEKCCTPDNRQPVMNYFYRFNILTELKLWKMQVLDRDHLLLKFFSEGKPAALIAVYNIHTTHSYSLQLKVRNRL